MKKFEYCVVNVTFYRDGTSNETLELLEVTMPGAHKASATNTFGSLGLLNALGSEGWELVDFEGGAFYMKRKVHS